MSDLKTQTAVNVAVDEAGRVANGSVQWLLEMADQHPITYGNALNFFICGQEGFEAIQKDLFAAKSTVDIICWGFDPGMELTRSGSIWPRGITYGGLLEDLTTRVKDPVTVRLLIWYDAMASAKQNNMPGYTDVRKWNTGDLVRSSSPYENAKRHQYCVDWWSRNLPHARTGTGRNPNLQIVLRNLDIYIDPPASRSELRRAASLRNTLVLHDGPSAMSPCKEGMRIGIPPQPKKLDGAHAGGVLRARYKFRPR